MANKDVSQDVLNAVKKKTGKNVSEKDIYKLASSVKPSTVQSEAQLKQLINRISGLVNVPVSEETVNELTHAIQSSKVSANNMEQMMKLITKKN